MGLMQRLRDLDAKAGVPIRASTESKVAFLERLASSPQGVVGPALAALAQEVLEQQRTIVALEARLAEVERHQG